MKIFKIAAFLLIFIATAISIDFRLANRAHQEILENSAHFQQRLSETELDFSGEQIQGCEITRIYALNAYQTCFVAWYDEPGGGIQGFSYIYHRPQPLSLFYGQTSESRYFRFSEYGTMLKQIRQDGSINDPYPGGIDWLIDEN